MSCIEVTASLTTLDFSPNAHTVSFLHFQKTFLENISIYTWGYMWEYVYAFFEKKKYTLHYTLLYFT